MNTTAPKRWLISVRTSTSKPLEIYCAGRPLTQSAPATVDDVSPVEYLLISVATCFALSCRAALSARQLPQSAFEVLVLGEKALDKPSRLASIDVAVEFGDALQGAEAEAVVRDAKQLCTVTNTILGNPAIGISARLTTA
jgi:uncharacterized OsmC-like protein